MSTPLLSNDILATLERILPDLGPSLRSVASFMLANTSTLGTISLEQLAKASGASKASVVRLCQALGFTGFRELQRAFQGPSYGLQSMVREARSDWPHGNSAPSEPSSTLSALVASVQGTQRLLHTPSIDLVARWIVHAERVMWYGLGDSGFLALSADHRCMINGFNSRALTASRDVLNVAKQLESDDVLICISRSGRLPTFMEAVRHVRSTTRAHVVAITGDPGSPLAQVVDVALISAPIDLYAEEQRTTLQTAQMAVLDTLIARVLQLRFSAVQMHGVPQSLPPNGGGRS